MGYILDMSFLWIMQVKSLIHQNRIRKYSHHMGFVKHNIFGILPNLFMNKDSLINPGLGPKEIYVVILETKQQAIISPLFLFVFLKCFISVLFVLNLSNFYKLIVWQKPWIQIFFQMKMVLFCFAYCSSFCKMNVLYKHKWFSILSSSKFRDSASLTL